MLLLNWSFENKLQFLSIYYLLLYDRDTGDSDHNNYVLRDDYLQWHEKKRSLFGDTQRKNRYVWSLVIVKKSRDGGQCTVLYIQ
jgi:hypothetical protein